MTKAKSKTGAPENLRLRAEKKAGTNKPEPQEQLSPREAQRVLHDLRVHQIELEMQNEELRRAQEALEISMERYFDLYELAPVGYFTLNEKGRILEANLAAAKLLGMERGLLVNQALTHFVLPEDQDIYYKHSKALSKTDTTQVFDIRLRNKNGPPLWVHLEATMGRGTDGGPVCRMVMSDITVRKQAEEMLIKSEENLCNTLLSLGEAMITTDSNGLITRMNPVAERLTGWTLPGAAGHPVRDVFHVLNVHTRTPVPDTVRQVLACGETVALAKHTILLARDGHEYNISASVAPIRNPAGSIMGTVLVFSDLTEQYRVHQALEKRLLALIQPLDAATEVEFSDIFEVESLQRLQDQFSSATGVASIMTEPNGTPITKPSNYTRLCKDIIHKTKKGWCNCCKTNVAFSKHFPSGPFIHPCLSAGFWKAGASIMVGGKHVANWIIGQVRNEAQDEKRMLLYADEIGADREAFRLAFAEVPRMSMERFEQTAKALDTIAQELSTRAYQNVQQARFINERKQAEAQLRLQSGALEAAANAIIITDKKGVIEWANTAFTTFTGYSTAEAIGKTPCLLNSGQQDQAFYQNLWNTILAGDVWHGELTNRRKDGSHYTEEMTITPMKDGHGEITHFIAVKQDITERKQMEEKLLRTQRLESIGTLAAGVAHDLNNILTPILLSTELLCGVEEPEERESLVLSIGECAQRGADVVNQLLTFARGTKGERRTLQLEILVAEMKKVMHGTFPKNIAVDTSIPSGLWLVKGDPTQIHQALLNLCINARDAMPEGGTLLISAANEAIDENFAAMAPDAKAGEYVMLAIADSGPCIPRGIIAKIFDPFFTTKELGKGTGLGLSTVIGIVRSHGGFVTVDSKEGRGSTFKVFLPRASDGAMELKHLPPTTIPKSTGETILLVDDEVLIARVTALLLEKNGYKVLAAAGGNEALALFKKHARKIKLVITDVLMPGMDGVELTRALKKIDPQVRIIASTGQATETHQTELQKLGVHVILSKPYSGAQLLTTLNKALRECIP